MAVPDQLAAGTKRRVLRKVLMSATLPCAASETSATISAPVPVLTWPPTLTVITASILTLVSAVSTLSFQARFSAVSSAVVSPVIEVAVMAGDAPKSSKPMNPASASAAKADLASIGPLWYSSVQSPPRLAAPVGSVEAATSAAVRRASEVISALPASPAATSQPYTRMSAPALRLVCHALNSAARLCRTPAFRSLAARRMSPALPWETM